MSGERDYVLGTQDDEIARLGLQHRAWRPRAADAWRRAGFTVGQTLLDVGCGPGFVTLDLAEIVGPTGRVIAVDRSRRFLDALEATRARRGIDNVSVFEQDLDEGPLPANAVDGAWARWVFAFVQRPRDLLERVAKALRPGATLVVHEYFHYETWRTAPRCPELEEFVQHVIAGWRASGGEPDIALNLPRWLAELGFEVRELRPLVEAIAPSSYLWQWPKSFVETALRRLVDLKRITADRATAIARAIAACETTPNTWMITPSVLEIVAVRR